MVPSAAIDANGHVGNLEYLRWMQDAAVAHSDAVGWTTERYRALGGTWVVRGHRIEYRQPAFEGQELVVQTWVTGFGRVQSQRRYRVWRPADRAVLAIGETDWVFLDLAKGRPRSIPEELAASFSAYGIEQDPPLDETPE
jgi:acyl-CoA thioester hydrolase